METALGLLLCDKIVPLLVDATTEYLSEHCNLILERVVGPADSDKYASCIQSYVLSKCHDLLIEQCTANGLVRVNFMFFFRIINFGTLAIIFREGNLFTLLMTDLIKM